MIIRAITIEDIDDLCLTWNSHINGSTLYRRVLGREVKLRDVGPNELRDLFESPRKQGYTKEEIVEETNRYADLKALVNYAVGSGVLEFCAALAARDNGSARQAFDLLRLAGEIAENEDRNRIEQDHVERARSRLKQEWV